MSSSTATLKAQHSETSNCLRKPQAMPKVTQSFGRRTKVDPFWKYRYLRFSLIVHLCNLRTLICFRFPVAGCSGGWPMVLRRAIKGTLSAHVTLATLDLVTLNIVLPVHLLQPHQSGRCLGAQHSPTCFALFFFGLLPVRESLQVWGSSAGFTCRFSGGWRLDWGEARWRKGIVAKGTISYTIQFAPVSQDW